MNMDMIVTFALTRISDILKLANTPPPVALSGTVGQGILRDVFQLAALVGVRQL
jgi:hypothetical protein